MMILPPLLPPLRLPPPLLLTLFLVSFQPPPPHLTKIHHSVSSCALGIRWYLFAVLVYFLVAVNCGGSLSCQFVDKVLTLTFPPGMNGDCFRQVATQCSNHPSCKPPALNITVNDTQEVNEGCRESVFLKSQLSMPCCLLLAGENLIYSNSTDEVCVEPISNPSAERLEGMSLNRCRCS